MALILALDQGTSSSRAILFDEQGVALSGAQKEITQIYPQPGWLEHSPAEIFQSQIEVATLAIERAGIAPKEIAAIGIANQRETTIVWDRQSGKAVANGIVWQDRRTKSICDRIRSEGWEQRIVDKTGLVLDPYFSASKIRWLLDSIPDGQRRAVAGELAFGTVDSWIIWNLTKGRAHVTDRSNASRTMLFNLQTEQWDDELLQLFQVPRAILPELVPSSGVISEALGVLAGIPIAGVGGDQQSALFGQMCTKPGMAKNTYGTGCFLLMNVGSVAARSSNRLLTTATCEVTGQKHYALEGSVFVAGAAVQWLRDGLGIVRSAQEIESLAREVASSNGVHLVPAFSGLGAPYWDDSARGALVGITGGTSRSHIARAALEAMAFQSVDLVEAMQRDSGSALRELRVDGGASANDLLMQIQADLLGVPVIRPIIKETTALGAAYLAGLGVGLWADPSALERYWGIERQFDPVISEDERTDRIADWHEAVARVLTRSASTPANPSQPRVETPLRESKTQG